MVAASLVKSPLGGNVETVCTRGTQRFFERGFALEEDLVVFFLRGLVRMVAPDRRFRDAYRSRRVERHFPVPGLKPHADLAVLWRFRASTGFRHEERTKTFHFSQRRFALE